MPQISPGLYSLNAGAVSALALTRVDLARLRLAAEVQENLIPMVLGPARFRPGTAYKARTHNDEDCRFLPFVFNVETKALVEVSTDVLRFLIDGVPIERPTVSAAVTNGGFDTDLTGWTDEDEAGATSDWAGGTLRLIGTGGNFAERRQEVTVTETGAEHALRIIVSRGPVVVAVGTTSGEDDYVSETVLRTGEHSIAFTPTGNFHISLKSDSENAKRVDSIEVESAGVVTLPSPWGTAYTTIRYTQSGDVLFVACDGIQQRRIERRSQRSWSIVLYQTSSGPFRAPNGTATTITPSMRFGTITLTASRAIFEDGHVGSLWRLFHSGQAASDTLAGEGQSTESIRVTGVSLPAEADTRPFRITLTGLTGTGSTVTLQRSFGTEGAWEAAATYTANTSATFDDGFDNQIVYYRLAIAAGDYSSGSVFANLHYDFGSQGGVVRVIAFTSETEVTAEVLETLGKNEATTDWEEGEWSSHRGFPSSVTFHDGRLWWGWEDRVFGSVSDAFDSYDDTFEGDAGPVVRSIATGPVEGVRWLLSVQRLLAGTASQEVSMRSSSFDEPITPTAFTAREFSNRGCANIQAVSVDGNGVFVQRNGQRVYEASLRVESGDYVSRDLTRLAIDICAAGIADIGVQRQPDTVVWFVLDDGTAVALTYEPDDEVVAWTTVVTDGLCKAVGVLPGTDEDEVYFAVERINSGATIMCIEKMAKFSECVGGTLSKNMDSHIVVSQASSTTISGLSHLQGLDVVVWGDGKPYPGPFTVTAGAITVPTAVVDAVVGLAYDGRFKSSKLAHGASTGSAVGKQKRIDHVALLMANVAWAGVRIGKDFADMTALPATLGNGRPLGATEVLATYDYAGAPFNGGWGPDSRICFKVSAPYPATFQGAVLGMATNEPQAYGTRPAAG